MIVVTYSKAIPMIINLFNRMNYWRLSIFVTLTSTINDMLLSVMLIGFNLCHRRRYSLAIELITFCFNDDILVGSLLNSVFNLPISFFNMNFFLFMLCLENFFLLFDLFKLLESILQLNIDLG
jgi:hypothetical protein